MFCSISYIKFQYLVLSFCKMIVFIYVLNLELHISESQSSVHSSAMAAAAKYKTRIAANGGLTNQLYYSSHKTDGDTEKTPPVFMREKHRPAHSNQYSFEKNSSPTVNAGRRPVSSPIRSTTYVLQQHHRINQTQTNNNHLTIPSKNINKKGSSPVCPNQPSTPSSTPMTLNKHRQAQQQRTFSNHERLPSQTSTAINTPLNARRTSPIVKNTPVKATITTISTNSTRTPRVSVDKRQTSIKKKLRIDFI